MAIAHIIVPYFSEGFSCADRKCLGNIYVYRLDHIPSCAMGVYCPFKTISPVLLCNVMLSLSPDNRAWRDVMRVSGGLRKTSLCTQRGPNEEVSGAPWRRRGQGLSPQPAWLPGM
jgi:hypothetical protein